MHSINVLVIYFYRKYGVSLHNFFSKMDPRYMLPLNTYLRQNMIHFMPTNHSNTIVSWVFLSSPPKRILKQ